MKNQKYMKLKLFQNNKLPRHHLPNLEDKFNWEENLLIAMFLMMGAVF